MLTARATDTLYQNFEALNYTIPDNPPPSLDVTAFDNESEFNINYSIYSPITIFYQPQNTLFYTNNGTMTVSTPFINVNGLIFISSSSTPFGCGFRFDQQATNVHTMADTFYNAGAIRCASVVDGNNVFTFGNTQYFYESSIGECIVSATNIINPGSIVVGVDGLMQLNGQNVDLSRSTLTMENLQNILLGNSAGVSSTGGVGTDTNSDWYPASDLGSTYAISSYPYVINLTNSTPYFDIQSLGPSNIIVRAVFVQDTSPNISFNVYFDTLPTDGGDGAAHVEWMGNYTDPATCSVSPNYLYLTDDYVFGASTNVAVVDGLPDNFYFTVSTAPLLGSPAAPGFYSVFESGSITNPYAYFDGQLIPTTTSTNVTASNPSGALTNIPGRIQITASKELDLSLAQISGQNYLALTCTNQFIGSEGAQIAAAYSDINLAKTNGVMVITNLLQSALPYWAGYVQAWSTRWVSVTNGVTNDFRVLIVRSDQLQSETQPQVRNLKLHATNSLVISDLLNVYGSLSIDAQNLTLATNGCGNGAGSYAGELNLKSSSITWSSALPNLRNLTNSGALTAKNVMIFGGASPANYYNFINNGLLTDQGSTIYTTNFLNAGIISNGVGSFTLQSITATLTNSYLLAGADISITANSVVTSNLVLQAARSLTLQVTNQLTDTGVTNGNIWVVGSTNGTGGNGFALPFLPNNPTNRGDLLGTTITNIAPSPNKQIANTWSGNDFGSSASGYTNNAAIGRLVLDGLGASSTFYFKGIGASNALYVDYLEFRDQATNILNQNLTRLSFNTNLIIYYAQAVINGVSVAAKINHYNTNHLQWVPTYAGYYSSTNVVYPDGTTNIVNAALAQSTIIDSDGDGIDNAHDSTPFFRADQLNFSSVVTNVPPLKMRLQWQTIPDATNYILYKTNLLATNWLTLTNFTTPSAPPYAPITNVFFDLVNPALPKFYKVQVDPNSTDYSGP